MNLGRIASWGARAACVVFCADILTMFAMNVFRLRTGWLPILFAVFLISTGIWVVRRNLLPTVRPEWLSAREQRFLLYGVIVFLIALAGMRWPYLLEAGLHHLAGPVVYDDTWHFSELNSLVNSVRYPAQYSLIPSQYFSLYYAPWMAIAALYLAFPVHGFTLKIAFAIGAALYQILATLSLLYLGFDHARSRRHFYWALYLIGGWAGVASLFALIVPFQHNSFWMACFGIRVELFNYVVLSTWAMHHLASACALLLCWHVWERAPGKNASAVLLCALLAACSFYSSIFVFLGALPIAVFLMAVSWRTQWKSITAFLGVFLVLVLPLLWIYMGKPRKISFLIPFIPGVQFTSRRFPMVSMVSGGIAFGFAIFLVLLCIHFFPHVFALGTKGKLLSWRERVIAGLAVAFVLSTYFIGFPEGNSYASRGSVIPLIFLGWICAALLPPVRMRFIVACGLLLGVLGSAQEIFWEYTQTVVAVRHAPGGALSEASLRINQDRKTHVMDNEAMIQAMRQDPDLYYYVEKFVPGGKPHLVTPDYELATRGPHGPWNWERLPVQDRWPDQEPAIVAKAGNPR
jgi:hypothetical protein